jgi:GTP-binding protein LepA
LVEEVGVFTPKRLKTDSLKAGEVGFLIASIKNIDGAPVGDTITSVKNPIRYSNLINIYYPCFVL